MKISYKKIVLWVAVIAVGVFVLMQPTFLIPEYSYEIKTVKNVCVFDEFPEQSVVVSGRDVVLTVPIATPTPCYEVFGSVASSGKEISVNLDTRKASEVCVECIGTVVAEVVISDIEPGKHTIQITTPDKVLIKEVTVQ